MAARTVTETRTPDGMAGPRSHPAHLSRLGGIPVAFVCGPYSTGDREENIRRAEEVARALWRLGYAVICPHLNSARFEDDLPEGRYEEAYMEILTRCDLVVVFGNWLSSPGASAEITMATAHRVPWMTLEELHVLLDFQRSLEGNGSSASHQGR